MIINETYQTNIQHYASEMLRIPSSQEIAMTRKPQEHFIFPALQARTGLLDIANPSSSAPTATEKIEQTALLLPCVRQSSLPFPWKLHEMLENVCFLGLETIVSWLPEENGFHVHDVKKFVATIMPRYFNQTKYKSFQRQLNMWGYERILKGSSKGGYTHEHFIRGNPSLCRHMRRQKIKGEAGQTGRLSNIDSPQQQLSDDRNVMQIFQPKQGQAIVNPLSSLSLTTSWETPEIISPRVHPTYSNTSPLSTTRSTTHKQNPQLNEIMGEYKVRGLFVLGNAPEYLATTNIPLPATKIPPSPTSNNSNGFNESSGLIRSGHHMEHDASALLPHDSGENQMDDIDSFMNQINCQSVQTQSNESMVKDGNNDIDIECMEFEGRTFFDIYIEENYCSNRTKDEEINKNKINEAEKGFTGKMPKRKSTPSTQCWRRRFSLEFLLSSGDTC